MRSRTGSFVSINSQSNRRDHDRDSDSIQFSASDVYTHINSREDEEEENPRDYHSEISSDLIESTRYIEKQFQSRYLILKNAYEERIQQLSMTLEETCSDILKDEIIDGMKADPTSSMFIPSLIQDILSSHLRSDREKYLMEVLNQENELKFLLQRQQEINISQNKTIIALETQVERNKESEEIMTAMKRQISSLNEQYQKLSSQMQEEVTTTIRQKESAELRESSLREQYTALSESMREKTQEIDRYRTEIDGKTKELFELEKSVELSGKDITFLEATETRYQNELEKMKQNFQVAADQKESLQGELLKYQEKVRLMTSEIEKYQQNELSTRQQVKKYQQNLSDIMKKAERTLEEEALNHESALEAYKRKYLNMKEKYESDLLSERNHNKQLQEQLNNLQRTHEEKKAELKANSNEINRLKDEYNHEYQKQLNLRKRIEELVTESARNKAELTEYEKKYYQLERNYHQLMSQNNHDLLRIKDQLKNDFQGRLEQERKQFERKSDMYRLRYENNFQEYLQHRPDPFTAASASFPPPPPPILSQSIEGAASTSHQHPREQSIHASFQEDKSDLEELRYLKGKLEKADVTIERLKKMVYEGKESVQHYKVLAEELKNQLKQSITINNSLQEKTDRSLPLLQQPPRIIPDQPEIEETKKRISFLESELNRSQQELASCQQQARHDQEEDTKLLEEMQRKFDILMDKYESSNQERNNELREKLKEIKELKEIISRYESEHRSSTDRDELKEQELIQREAMLKDQMREEIKKLMKEKEEVIELRVMREREKEKEIEEMLRKLKRAHESELLEVKAESSTKLEELMEEIKEEQKRALNEKNKSRRWKDFLTKLHSKYESEREISKRMILKLKSSVLLLQSTMESELDLIKNKWLYYGKNYAEKVFIEAEEKFKKQLNEINQIHFERELDSQSGRNSKSRDQSQIQISHFHALDSQRTSLPMIDQSPFLELICTGYHQLIFRTLDLFQSSGFLSDGSCRDIQYLLTPLPAQIILLFSEAQTNRHSNPNISLETLGFGVLAAKITDILTRGTTGFLNEKDQLSNELRIEKLRREEKENQSLNSSRYTIGRDREMSSSLHHLDEGPSNSLSISNVSTHLYENDEKNYLQLQIKHLTQQINEMKLQHKHEIERIKAEYSMKESLLQDKIDSLTRTSAFRNEEALNEIESKLRTEQTRRQHLQTRLLAEESAHRKELEEIQLKCHEFQKRAEKAELELTKNRISGR